MADDKDTSRLSYAQNVDVARHPLDDKKGQAKKAFNRAAQIRQERAQQKDQGRRPEGSEMVKKDKPSPEYEPKGPGRDAVKRTTHKKDLSEEKARAERINQMAQQALENRNQQDQGKGRG